MYHTKLLLALNCLPSTNCSDLIKLPVDSSFRLPLASVDAAINDDTICVYASAPTFPHGQVDPIEGLSDIVLRHRAEKRTSGSGGGGGGSGSLLPGLHVDNCLGGVLLSHLSSLGLFNRPWDFLCPGVTSISMDIHKYGYAAKGASTVTFRSNALRRACVHPVTNISGGFYVTPTLQGSRNGSLVASAWATIKYVGRDGYESSARRLNETLISMKAAVRATEGIRLLCDNDLSIVTFTPEDPAVPVSRITRAMDKRGWSMFSGVYCWPLTVCP